MARKTFRNTNGIKKKIIFVADLFRQDLIGGGECNDHILINHFISRKYNVVLKKCPEINLSDMNKKNFFIIGNFISLSEQNKRLLKNEEYLIYEHDHKYLTSRDPSVFKDFIAPPENIINKEFYENAKAVVVLSKICKEIIEKSLHISNVHNIGCSLWSDEKLDLIESLSEKPKNDTLAIINSSNPIKSTHESIEYCAKNNIQYEVLPPSQEKELLEKLADYKGLVFFPKVLETFSRISAETKMLNCKLLTTPKMLGFASEEIYKLSGRELIQKIRERKNKALELFVSLVESE